ncbi:hypothetical protein QQ008_07045 [Fulvivirgaceae bacterium BMA10]|uniref:Outer membrane protein beta-barrel domain-containing protein n=1 Tax=Splendidivirga corallicola TaxID=3051826 RepID=A0ABT8KK71_9BACT|nr:hypothetical protein [Fulvivirgaceae bacterium BMA10]
MVGKSWGQVSVGYYPFQSIFSVGSNPEKPLWVDFRFETNTFFSNLNSEISPMVNVLNNEWVRYYIGLGLNFNLVSATYQEEVLNGYSLTIGSRVSPLIRNKCFNVIFEISPFVNKSFNGGLLRTNLGLAYILKKNPQ